MIGVALKGLAGRKIRAVLTAFAIVIGVAMVSGTFVLTDTIQKSFSSLFDASSANTDAVISAKQVVENSTNGSSATIPAALLEKVRALPEVAAAGGEIVPEEANVADVIGSDGKKSAQESLGSGLDPKFAKLTPLALKAGAWPKGPQQVAIDAGTATKEHYAVGDKVTISTLGKRHEYQITGTLTYGGADSLGIASVATWDTATAQKLLGREGRYDTISMVAKAGTSRSDLVKAVRPLVPAGLEVKDSVKASKDDAKELNDSTSIIRSFLLGFGGIALLVGAFVIFNTLSITVAQRTREFATLRTLGASRKQVMRSVVLEGLVLGLVASIIGLVAGFGLAKGMIALLSAAGVDLPESSTIVASRTVIVSLLVGTIITLLASILPARRATRVPPIAAVREGSTLPPSRLEAHSRKTGVVVSAVALAAVSIGVFASGLNGGAVALLLGVGVLGLFAGIALLAPSLVPPLARAMSWPGRQAGGVPAELAGANAARNPKRTASTAAALMIGLTLVTVVAVLGSGLRASTKDAVAEQVRADYVVDGNGDLPFRAAEGDELAAVAGVTNASQVRSDRAIVKGSEDAVSGIDPATIAHFYRFKWAGGSEDALTRLGTDGAIVTSSYAKDEHLSVGGTLPITTPSGEKRRLVVRGIYDAPDAQQLLGSVSISQKAFDSAFANPKNSLTFLDADAAAKAAITSAAGDFSDAKLHTGAAFADDSTKDLATVLAMLYVLLGFSVVVSLFGMVNTMVLSVFERTREIGMLRTIGMTRRQARRMIRHESVITALIGAALGLGLGVFLAALVTQAMADQDLALSIPWPTLFGFTLVAVVAGIGAAVLPARRASRLNVLDALQYE